MTCTAMAGVLAAQRCIAAAIVVITSTGKTAEVVAKYKPRCPIIAVTRYAPVARRLHLFKAVVPLVYEGTTLFLINLRLLLLVVVLYLIYKYYYNHFEKCVSINFIK